MYLGIVRKTRSTGFRLGLDAIAEKTGLTKASVRRANDCLKQLGWLGWNRGFGFVGFGVPNEYVLDLKALETAGVLRTRRQ